MARVIPPLVAISPGVAGEDALFVVSEAMLTSTTVPEEAPAAYSSGTTYADGAQVSVAAAGNALDVYESLEPGNIGHTPASSPLWWRFVGQTYGVYSAGTPYAEGDRVIDVTTHLQYVALAASTGVALSDASKWKVEGATNRWRALDVLRNTGATAPSPMTYVITPGKRISAVGLSGLLADRFTITVRVGGVVKWTRTEKLSTRITLSWSDYFFGPFTYRSVAGVFDIPKYAEAEIELTFERDNGDVTVGGIWINDAVYLGELETEPGIDRRSFVTFERDLDGNAILIRRPPKPANTWLLFLPKSRLPRVGPLPAELDGVPCFWSGLEDATDEYFEPTTIIGVFTRFTITPGHPDVRIDLELEDA